MEVDFKTCSKCKETKSRAEFHTAKSRLDGLRSCCKTCESIRRKAYYASNRDKELADVKAWQKANRDRVRSSSKAYRDANRDAARVRYKAYCDKFRALHGVAYNTDRKRRDPQARLAGNLRRRLHHAIRGKFKTGSAVRDLGMPIDAFLTYLNLDAIDKYGLPYTGNESKFHIDHIRPLASFNLEDVKQLKQAVHWSNLQVLRAEENLQKGAEYVQPTTSNPPISAQGKVATP